MSSYHKLLPGLVLIAVAACTDNPILEPDVHAEDLDVALSFSVEELVTLTEMEVEVEITNHEGVPFTDFEMVGFEYRMEGETEWETTELELHEGHFSADHMFFSSGEYEVRVTGTRHGADHSETLFEQGEHAEVERIHMEAGEYRIEMETFPGRIHEGDEAEVRFWVAELGTDGHSGGHGMGGLNAQIHLSHDASGSTQQHMADEHEDGVYEAMHLFDEAGEFEVMMSFQDEHGDTHEAAFHVPVSHDD